MRLLILILLLLTSNLFAQTTQWRLLWDSNIEDDMSQYYIYRSTISEDSVIIDSVTHIAAIPTQEYVDTVLESGIIYYYRLKAVNLSGLTSDYSAEVSACIPDIHTTSFTAPNGSMIIDFADIFFDEDHTIDELRVDVSEMINVSVVVDSQFNLLINNPNPLGFVGNSTFLLRVEDPDEFYDLGYITITFTTPPVPFKPENLEIIK